MITNDLTIKIGGEAGMGVESGGAGLVKALARGGLYVFGFQDYMSRVRGGHNFFQIRAAAREVFTFNEDVHLLLAFTEDCIDRHKHEVVRGGAILYDEALGCDSRSLEALGIKACPVPFSKIASEAGGAPVMANTCAIGAAAGITDYDFERIRDVIQENFGKKGEEMAAKNLAAAKAGYDYAKAHFAQGFEYKLRAVPLAKNDRRMLLNGNQALGLGAMAGGCKFIAAYPMTPATTIFEFITAKASQYGIVSKQTEDEIAAILFAIGASHAGARAMTCTSGGGFSLMVEALGLAAMTETPVVIAEVQRTGPSTGFPTRTEQPDLDFVIHASHGESPRIVIAPATIEDCFEAGWRAFNLAEKYQCPVIILSDLYLSSQIRSIDSAGLDFSKVRVDRGELLTEEALEGLSDYKRYLLTDSGISPRALPGHPNAVYVATSDEHSEQGYAIEEAEPRRKMMEKRMHKLELASKEDMREPECYGDADAELTLLCWGSVYGAVREVVDRLVKKGMKANLLKFTDLWPFPAEKVRPYLERAKHLVAVENNYTGQLANLIRRQTGIQVDGRILKYDGRPFSPEEIIANLKEEMKLHVKTG
ncbi:MAG: 2-oxoacid:acceptor oxidoreductase subunit alpha [Candidatus Omnitrophica bacterium]|nr:2-oxoacid:acceptor oxidoreductase subunit alpha [Candidatus Omnitrophota bacterium]